jgi:hypothetical protein
MGGGGMLYCTSRSCCIWRTEKLIIIKQAKKMCCGEKQREGVVLGEEHIASSQKLKIFTWKCNLMNMKRDKKNFELYDKDI